jgi:peptidoglycan/xylan/chitin deacetylase (PgdA/CDA1 family)
MSHPLVLCYHAVSETWPSPGAISPSRLGAQLRFLLRLGYSPMTLSEAIREGAPRRAMVVTFDDAYRSILERGLPILEALGVPATVFVPTDAAGGAGPMTWSELGTWVGTEHEHELRCMSWDELRHLSGRGWEIGSHTCSHPRLAELAAEAAGTELSRSRQICEEELQISCISLAYPFGSYDSRVMELVAAAGYRTAVTLNDRMIESLRDRGPLDIPREGIYRATGWPIFLAQTSALGRLFRRSRTFAALT